MYKTRIESLDRLRTYKDILEEANKLFAKSDEITYTITITNNSNSNYYNLNIIENIDSKLSVVDNGNGVLENNELKWTIQTIGASDKITLSYTVKVLNKQSLLGKFVLSTGKVDNIATSKIEILIGNRLTKEEQQKLLNSFNSLKSNYQLERDFINQVYIDALNIDLGLEELNNLDIISYDSENTSSGKDYLSVKYTKLNDTPVKKYVYSNFYGLRINSSANREKNLVNAWTQWNPTPSLESNDRARTLTSDMLLDGDIVLVYGENLDTADVDLINKSYLYLNNTLYRKKTENEFEEISGNDLTVFLRNLIGENYIVLRPSLALSNDIETFKVLDQEVQRTLTKNMKTCIYLKCLRRFWPMKI